MASSSSVSVFGNYRFKTAFNEELYNTIVKNKKVIVECCFDLDDDEYPEVREQIALRGWRRLAAPKPEISIDLIHGGQVQAQDGKSRLALLRPNVTFLHSNVTKTKPPQACVMSRLGLANPSPKRDHP
ncbi:hypothetical protein PIB30_062685 [Stylosanthes scabra]|uniref:Uncharacterized protein n=1 Tax=Stylosanthes scabra TaxID=79078 RepID=A0ABU6VPF6_9FABA|nr:hypothetical protein [Stylosanthes scabra]